MATTIQYPEGNLTNTTSRASFFNMFKDDYLPQLNSWIHTAEAQKINGITMKKRGTMGGTQSVAAVFTSNPQSIAFGLEGHILPVPSSSTSANPSIIARAIRYRLRWTEESQTAARKGNSAAWSAPKAAELEMARDQMARNIALNQHHGRYNVLATIAASAGSTITLNSANARTSAAQNFYNVGAIHLRPGMDIQIVRIAAGLGGRPAWNQGTTGAGRVRIRSVDSTNEDAPTIVVEDGNGALLDVAGANYLNGAVADGDLIIPFDSRRHSGVVYPADPSVIGHFASMNGLVDFQTDSTITPYVMGLTKTAYAGLQAEHMRNGGVQRPFDELMIHVGMRRVRQRSGKTPAKLLMNDAQFTEAFRENLNGRQFEPVLGQSGHKNLAFVDFGTVLKYETDEQCLPGLIWGLDPDNFGYFEQKPLSPPPGYDGEKRVHDYAMSEVVATKLGNVMCKRPELGFCIDDLIYDYYDLVDEEEEEPGP